METSTAPTLLTRKRGVRLTVVSFAVCIAALIGSAIALSALVNPGQGDAVYLWAMVLMGAVVITLLLSAVFLPHLAEIRRHR